MTHPAFRVQIQLLMFQHFRISRFVTTIHSAFTVLAIVPMIVHHEILVFETPLFTVSLVVETL